MEISFDPKKDAWTKRERGISLSLGAKVIAHATVRFLDERFDYGEDRIIAFGYVEKRLYVCVYTMRGDVFHIISVRKANDRETRKYG
jgi:uncharacterized protein